MNSVQNLVCENIKLTKSETIKPDTIEPWFTEIKQTVERLETNAQFQLKHKEKDERAHSVIIHGLKENNNTMEELMEDDLVRILREPKNALTKQYQKLFEFENIQLRFTEGALTAVARKALERKSGARGLRSVLEQAMLDVMYDLPSKKNVQECVVSEQVITNGDYPVILYQKSDVEDELKSA